MNPPDTPDLSFINTLYGGYWNYDLMDFRYMINPHFPPQEMLDTIAASVGLLSRSYPSTNRHISKLFSDYLNLGVEEEAAEYYVRDELPTCQGWAEEGDEEHVVVVVEMDCADEACCRFECDDCGEEDEEIDEVDLLFTKGSSHVLLGELGGYIEEMSDNAPAKILFEAHPWAYTPNHSLKPRLEMLLSCGYEPKAILVHHGTRPEALVELGYEPETVMRIGTGQASYRVSADDFIKLECPPNPLAAAHHWILLQKPLHM